MRRPKAKQQLKLSRAFVRYANVLLPLSTVYDVLSLLCLCPSPISISPLNLPAYTPPLEHTHQSYTHFLSSKISFSFQLYLWIFPLLFNVRALFSLPPFLFFFLILSLNYLSLDYLSSLENNIFIRHSLFFSQMCILIYLSFSLFVSAHFTSLYFYLFFYLSTFLSIYLSIYLYIYLSIYVYIYIYIYIYIQLCILLS